MSHTLTPADVAPDVARTVPSLGVHPALAVHVLEGAPDGDPFRNACETLAALYNQGTAYGAPWTDADGVQRHGAVEHAPYRAVTFTTNPVDPGTFDPRPFDGQRGGGVPDASFSAVPADPMGAHTVKRGRNRKGSTVKVIGRGDAPVIGRMHTDVNGAPLLAAPSLVADVGSWAWCAARMLVTDAADGSLRRHRSGWSGIGVARITDQAASLDADFPRLAGTDAMAWAQLVPGDRASRSVCAVQRTDITAGANPAVARFAAPVSGYVAHTSRLTWSARRTIVLRRRASDPGAHRIAQPTATRPGATVPAVDAGDWFGPMGTHTYRVGPRALPATSARPRVIIGHPMAHGLTITVPHSFRMWHRWEIVTASGDTERLHVGRRTVARVRATDGRKRTTATRGAASARVKARTIGTVPAPTTAGGWAALCDGLNRGERVVAVADGRNVTITRGKRSGVWSATDKRGDSSARWQTRTAESMGNRLAD